MNKPGRKAALSSMANLPDGNSQRVRAYPGFTQQILSGGIRSGQCISQRELMTLPDMPLGAVRKMIPRLEAAGLIKKVPQRDLQVAHVDLKLIRNSYRRRRRFSWRFHAGVYSGRGGVRGAPPQHELDLFLHTQTGA